MKKASKVITAIFVVLTVLIAHENIISSATDWDLYIATANLNVRTGAGTEYSIIFTLQRGDEVEILSKKGNWYKIRYLGKRGYAFSKYLEYSRTVPGASSRTVQQIMTKIVLGISTISIILVGFIIFRKIRDKQLLNSVTKTNRGTRSERDLVLKLLKYGIPAQNIYHDLYLKKNNGNFSQIDLVVISEVGIIVFEVKDYSGWIFGDGNQPQWTQVLAYGKKKYRFYNPIMQNAKHIGELRRKLKHFENLPFYSIVLFIGDCVLKNINFVPKGTFLVKSNRVLEVMNTITKNNEPFYYSDKDEVVRILKEAVKNGEYPETQVQHIENVRDMLGKERIFD